jgi:putative peptidoglycan lipid II flippase
VSLTPSYGFSMLALGTSVSIFINCFLQVFFLIKILGLSIGFFLNLRVFKMLFAGLLCFGSTVFIKQMVPILGQPTLQKIMSYILAAGVGASVYLVALYVLGERKDVKDFLNKFKKKRRNLH